MLTALSGKEDAALLQLRSDSFVQGFCYIHAGVSADPFTEDLAGGAAYDKQHSGMQVCGVAELCGGPLCLFPDLTEFRVYFHGSLLFESDYSTRRISVRI